MGMDLAVNFAGPPPTWEWLAEVLSARGLAVELRMIDGMPAFPDENPPESWTELRVSLGGGMITMRRTDRAVQLVVWGNAERTLVQERNALAWAWATAGGGEIDTPEGRLSGEAFARTADLPPGLAG